MACLREHLSDKVTFLGPTPKPIARTHNLYHYQIIIKYRFEDSLEETLNRILDMTQEPENKDLRLIIDHEPQNLPNLEKEEYDKNNIYGNAGLFSDSAGGTLTDERYDIVAVVTQPDRAVGRKKEIRMTPVKELALAHELPIYQLKNYQALKKWPN